MLKLTGTMSARNDWTDEETIAHYSEHHGPLVASTAGFTAHLVKYIQNRIVNAPAIARFEDRRADRIVISELWFEDFSHAKAAFSSSDFRFIRADERRFANLEGASSSYGHEHKLFDADPIDDVKAMARQPLVKLFVFRRRKADISGDEFEAQWLDRGRSMDEQVAFGQHVRRYVQTHTIRREGRVARPDTPDVIDEFWFAAPAAAAVFWAAYRASQAASDTDKALTMAEWTWTAFMTSHVVFAERVEWVA